MNDFDAVTGPGRVARWFGDVTVERYPCDLDVPTAEPVLAYLASVAGDLPVGAAREFVEARIAVDGGFRIRKHTVLILGSR